MKKIFPIAFLLLAIFSLKAEAQSPYRQVSLLVAECRGESYCEPELVKYDFINGDLKGKETILGSDLDWGGTAGSRILENRYLISGNGDVVDLIKREILHKSRGNLLKIEKGLLYYEHYFAAEAGIFVFDIETRTYKKLLSPNKWELPGELSPDETKSAVYRLDVIEIHQIGNPAKILKAELGAAHSAYSSDMHSVPLIWLDNERILTQRYNGDFVVLDLNGKVSDFARIGEEVKAEPPPHIPKFFRNLVGNIQYYGSERYLLDVKTKSYKKGWTQFGNGFESGGTGFWKTYYLDGEKIGRFWATDEITTKDFIAIGYQNKGETFGYPKGIKIWNKVKKDWITIDIDSPQILGWVEN